MLDSGSKSVLVERDGSAYPTGVTMGRNLYILAGTLGTLALISVVLSFLHIGDVPGTPSDVSLWRTTGIALLAVSLIVALAGVLSSLFEQAERRAEQQREGTRRKRRPEL